MENPKFKVGDRVELLINNPYCGHSCAYINKGEKGKVVHLGYESIGIEFDHSFRNGHNMLGMSKPGFGWLCHRVKLLLNQLYEGGESVEQTTH